MPQSSCKTNAAGFPQWPYRFETENDQHKKCKVDLNSCRERWASQHIWTKRHFELGISLEEVTTAVSNREKAHHMLCSRDKTHPVFFQPHSFSAHTPVVGGAVGVHFAPFPMTLIQSGLDIHCCHSKISMVSSWNAVFPRLRRMSL